MSSMKKAEAMTMRERLPAEVEEAIRSFGCDAIDLAHALALPDRGNKRRKTAVTEQIKSGEERLRQAILAALEPERALRQRAERLRLVVVEWDEESPRYSVMARLDLKDGDLADDILTDTSSANVRREET